MTNYELISLLLNNKVVDAFQFFSTCNFKITSSKVSFKALNNLVDEYITNETKERNSMFEEVLKTGHSSLFAKTDNKDFFGQEVSRSILIDKLTIEVFSTLHSFFDTYAQWINAVLFGDLALPIKTVSLGSVISKIDQFSEYSGQFVTDFRSISISHEYKYISDINNVIKHRHQIYTKAKFNLFEGTGSVTLPAFHKDNNSYSDVEVLNIISTCINYCEKLLLDSINFVELFYSTGNNLHVSKRIYNPKTYMLFENEKDYQELKNIKNSIHFIELDQSNMQDEYQILLFSNDTTNKEISMYNSPYEIIAIKDISTNGYIGILKPLDTASYTFNDGRLLEYRKYKVYKQNFELGLVTEMLNQNFHYYPYLSDLQVVILNPNATGTEDKSSAPE